MPSNAVPRTTGDEFQGQSAANLLLSKRFRTPCIEYLSVGSLLRTVGGWRIGGLVAEGRGRPAAESDLRVASGRAPGPLRGVPFALSRACRATLSQRALSVT